MGILSEIGKCFLPSHEAFIFMWLLGTLGIAAIIIVIDRWLTLNRVTDYDAPNLFQKLKSFITNNQFDEAYKLCQAGGNRALPRIFAAGIKRFTVTPELVMGAMTEESLAVNSNLDRRLNLLVMFGNVSTLLGLLGTVFGLIASFAAVGKPGVAAVEKSALLAAGISAAMNSTLVGLSISIPCVMAFSWLRTRVDSAIQETERYSVAILNLLTPPDSPSHIKNPVMNMRRGGDDEEAADTDVTPLLNIMVMLIPLLLTSSEFVKIGAIEMKLPESTQGSSGGGGSVSNVPKNTNLDVGVVITSKGFNVFSYFKASETSTLETADIPLKNNEYDFAGLNKSLSDIKKKALAEIIKSSIGEPPSDATLFQLYNAYQTKVQAVSFFNDHEDIKIVAEEKVKYQTVVAVMDAARGITMPEGNVTMFPNVSLGGGIVQ